MEQREGFKRVTIEDMKAKKTEGELQKVYDEVVASLDELVSEEAEKLAQQLVDDGHDVDSFEIQVDHELVDGKVIAHLSVIQEATTLTFDLAGNKVS